MIHTIFFDVGGTLVTSRSTLTFFADRLDPDNKFNMFDFLLKNFMIYYENDKSEIFYSVKEILALAVRAAAKQFDLPDLSGEIEKYYRKNHLDTGKLYDDTLPTLLKLREQKISLILASDADSDVLIEQLEKLNILKYFEGHVISSEVKAYKPSDKVVRAARQYCTEPLSEILFVGDSWVDIKTAEKMGVKSVLIKRNGQFKIEADYKIMTLEHILEIINE